jgi:hypothetical protein
MLDALIPDTIYTMEDAEGNARRVRPYLDMMPADLPDQCCRCSTVKDSHNTTMPCYHCKTPRGSQDNMRAQFPRRTKEESQEIIKEYNRLLVGQWPP